MKFDLHMHTRRHSPDSVTNPFDLVARAREVGLDGVVLTEHDYQWQADELAELQAAAPDLLVLAGMELTGRGGDVLLYGVSNTAPFHRGMGWGEICREVHRQGGVAVAAHPYRWGQPFDKVVAEANAELDGIEVMSNNMDESLRIQAQALLARSPQYAQLGNSDSHDPLTVGVCYTDFDAEIHGISDLVEAIRNRKGTARVNDWYSR